MPYCGLVTSGLTIEFGPLLESEVPLKQTACAAEEAHESCTRFVDCGCWKVNWPSRI